MVIGFTFGAILTPISAIVTCASTYLVSDVVKDNVEDEDAKEIFS